MTRTACLGVLLLGLMAGAWLVLRIGHQKTPLTPALSPSNGQREKTDSPDLKAGRELAQQVCGSCHIFPEPDLADRFTWANGILPRMSYWLGYDTVSWTNEPGGDQVLASGKIPNRSEERR